MTLPESAANDEARTIRSSRRFAEPRERIWNAHENPVGLAAWWGPAGFTNAFHAFDFRPGGIWDFTMRGPDGGEYRMRKVFVEIDAPGRLVFDHPDPGHGFRMFMDFREISTGTALSWLMLFDSADEAARVRPFILEANEQNFDRLADYLSSARA